MHHKTELYVLFLFMLWLLPSGVFAQPTDVSKCAQGSLTQLSFDCTAAAAKRKTAADKEELLEKWVNDDSSWLATEGLDSKQEADQTGVSAVLGNTQSSTALKPEPTQTPTAPAVVALEPTKVGEAKQMIVLADEQPGLAAGWGQLTPRIKGPLVDPADPNLITSRQKWQRQGKESCSLPKSEQALKGKSAALKEVFYRFSGNDDFYLSLQSVACRDSCAESGKTAEVLGFAVSDAKGGDFKINEEGASCRYQFAKPKDAGWKMLTARKVICGCF